MSKRTVNFPMVNEDASGIDIGSREHYVAIGLGADNVRRFGVYTQDLHDLAKWLLSNGIKSIAMESTGDYWRSLFLLLQDYGFEVILVNARHTKNVRGRKSDVQDCQWIYQLHSAGLLSGSYQPEEFSEQLRTYTRLRASMIRDAARYISKMQHSLILMNVHLSVVLSDITGKSGRRIIEAILSGERDSHKLAKLADRRVKCSYEEMVKALEGHWKNHHLDALRLHWASYQFQQDQISKIDEKIEELLKKKIIEQGVEDLSYEPENRKKVRRGENIPDFDLSTYAFQLSEGVDLMAIPGVGYGLILTLLAEVGFDLSKFPTANHFTSWLGLAPNVKVSGGKVISSRTPRNGCRLGGAFRMAANSVGNKKDGVLAHKFRKLSYRKGRKAAITATARRLATIVYHMLTKNEAFREEDLDQYLTGVKQKQIIQLEKRLNTLKAEQAALAV